MSKDKNMGRPGVAQAQEPGTEGYLERAETIVRRMGYPDTEQGPYVTELRGHVLQQCMNGLIGMSGGTWAPEARLLSWEERARATLAFTWAADRYAYKTELLDSGPLEWRTDVRTMKRRLVFRWRYVAPWLRDNARRIGNSLHHWWDRRVLRISNPYAAGPDAGDSGTNPTSSESPLP